MKPNQFELDLKALCAQPPFRRFLLHVTRLASIHAPTAGASEHLPYREGQRSLGLEILREAARGFLPRKVSVEQLIGIIASEATPEETEDDTAEPESRT